MNLLHRRQFLHLAAGAVWLAPMSRIARADAYPSRAARIIVGVPAGGSPDIQARLIGQWLSERLGQPFIVENRPGGGTNIATEAVVRAPTDGYTLLLVTAINTWNASLYEKLNFDFIRDIAPVAGLNRQTFVMMVTPSISGENRAGIYRLRQSQSRQAQYGVGRERATAGHVVGELFKMMAGVDMLHVPYRGAPLAQTALMTGELEVSSIRFRRRSNRSRAASCAPWRSPPPNLQKHCRTFRPWLNFCPGSRRTAGRASALKKHTRRDR